MKATWERDYLVTRASSVPDAKTISFSGVDGAGKSTQIERLVQYLESCGMRVCLLRFWDDIAALKRFRESAGHQVFRGEKGVGSPEAPVNRRDKNVRGWAMTSLRLFLYVLDAFALRGVFKRSVRRGADVVIFDRYTYDEIANLDLNRGIVRAYIHFLLWLVPRPCISFVLDADPEAARARKPEYPLEFVRFNRENYKTLAKLLGYLRVIHPAEIERAHVEVREAVMALLCPGAIPSRPQFQTPSATVVEVKTQRSL